MTRRDDTGLVTPVAVMFTMVFAFIAAVLFDGGMRLVAIQRAADEAAAAGDHALNKNLDVSHVAAGGLRLDPDAAKRDAEEFARRFGHDARVSVDGTTVTVTVRIEYKARLAPLFDGPVHGTAKATPLLDSETASR
jgi:hypothetical protein